MGTRHLTLVRTSDRLFGQYGQWDGYPGGQGVAAFSKLKKILNESLEERFLGNFRNANFNGESIKLAILRKLLGLPEGADVPEWIGYDVAKNLGNLLPSLSRDTGAKVLDLILEAPGVPLIDSTEFAQDSLFCEWAWMLDFSERKFRCFKGFNQTPLSPADFFYSGNGGKGYFPVREIASFTFQQVSEMSSGDFLNEFSDAEDE